MDSKTAPQISIVMPTYNRAHLVGRAIESVISQTFQDWELIVIDDASTDGTLEMLHGWRNKDPRIVVIHNAVNQYPDISKTLNQGLAVARGKYIARVDDDDYWIAPEKLEKQIAFLETHTDHVLVGTGVIVVDDAGNERYRYLKREDDAAIRRTTWSAICLRGRINHGNSSARSTRRCLKSYGASDMITLVFCAASLSMVPDISILFCPY